MSDKHTDALDLDKLEAQTSLPDGSVELLREASNVIAGLAPRRERLADELEFFAEILSHRQVAAQLADSTAPGAPIPMILFCPKCGKQHIDAPDARKFPAFGPGMDVEPWTNPPHRSHLCHGCGNIWRPADVATEGVAALKTAGSNDSLAVPTAQQSLTAGGAVLEDELLAAFEKRFNGKVLLAKDKNHSGGWGYVDGYVQGMWTGFKAAFAAAPLPQVQSEGLEVEPEECWSSNNEDFNSKTLGELIDSNEDLKPGDTVWRAEAAAPAAGQLIDADDVMTTMSERADDIAGEYAEGYPDVTKEAEQELNGLLAGWIGKHARPTFWTVSGATPYVLTDDDFAVNQQPVTPSGALADNDGGVA